MQFDESMRGYWWSGTYVSAMDITLVQLQYSVTVHNVRPGDLFQGMEVVEVDYDNESIRSVNLDTLHYLDQQFGTLSHSKQFDASS